MRRAPCRDKGFMNDMKKNNNVAGIGSTLLRCASITLMSRETIERLSRILKQELFNTAF